jgi:hypothetical protein
MEHDEIGSFVSAVVESGARELLYALTRSEADRAALIDRLAIREDAAWLQSYSQTLRSMKSLVCNLVEALRSIG